MAGPWERYQNQDGPWTKYARQTQEPVREPDEDTNQIGGLVEGTLGGVYSGLADVIGAPVDLANMGLRAAGVDAEIPGGSENVRGAMNYTFGRLRSDGDMFPEGPDTRTGRILNRMGREVGATMIPGGGMIAAGTRMAAPGIKKAPSIVRGLLEPIGRSPGRAALGETAVAAGAGAGAGVAREAKPDSTAAEVVGQIVGGLGAGAAGYLPGALVMRGTNFARKYMSSPAQGERARRYVGKHLKEELDTPRARAALDQAEGIEQEIPGFRPSLAEASDSPSLIRKQVELENRMSGEDLDRVVARRLANQEAVENYARQSAPEGEEPGFVVDTARRQVDDLRSRIDRAAETADESRRRLAEQAAPADLSAQGNVLRTELRERLGDEQMAWESVATDSGLNDDSFKVPFHLMRESLVGAFDTASKVATRSGQRVANKPSVVRVVEDMKDIQSFPAMMELRSDISSALRQAQRLPSTDDATLRGLRQMKATFDNALEEAVKATDDPEIAQRYADFRQRYLTDFIEPYKQRSSHDILHKDSTGAYMLPDEQVAKAYFSPGGASAAQQFKRVFGSDEMAHEALRAVAFDSLNKAAVRDGVLDPRMAETWMRQHRTVLDEFPEIRAQVSNLAEANKALVSRQKSLANRKRAVEDAILSRELGAVGRDTRSAEAMVVRAMESPRKMGQLVARIRNFPEARNALQRAIWDQVAGMEPGRLTEYLHSNAATFRMAGISDEHMNALKTIDAARSIMSRTPMPKGSAETPNSVTALREMAGIDPATLMNRIHAWHTGRTEKSWLVTNVLALVSKNKLNQRTAEMYRQVLYDPEAAKALKDAIMTGKIEPAARRLYARWFAVGLTPIREYQEEPEDR